MAKDKKKKKDKQEQKAKSGKSGSQTVASLKALAQNPVVAEVVAAALVATAAALKDPKKARMLAADTGDEVGALKDKGAQSGSALWALALDVGRSALQAINEDSAGKKKSK